MSKTTSRDTFHNTAILFSKLLKNLIVIGENLGEGMYGRGGKKDASIVSDVTVS